MLDAKIQFRNDETSCFVVGVRVRVMRFRIEKSFPKGLHFFKPAGALKEREDLKGGTLFWGALS
jgi:hypothetical protein